MLLLDPLSCQMGIMIRIFDGTLKLRLTETGKRSCLPKIASSNHVTHAHTHKIKTNMERA